MSNWHAAKLRKAFLDFFAQQGHAVIKSASLVPENDPLVLFTTAGMHPLVPYLMGQSHPGGKRLASCQKCIRTQDIDEVGDEMHDTFFEMLGNWSLGDYFKSEAITWSHEFLTGSQWLNLDAERLFISVFAGDQDAPRDEEAAAIWQAAGIPAKRIVYLTKSDNWWGPAGLTGPCGPDTEMFYDLKGKACRAGEKCLPGGCECGRFLEIWNDVFMQYNKQQDGSFKPLAQKNVDTGMGLERTLMVLQGVKDIFATDVFAPLVEQVKSMAKRVDDLRSLRIVTDHVRAATFILGEPNNIAPSNVAQGYVLRRLIRRAIRHARLLGIEDNFLPKLAEEVIRMFKDEYPHLENNRHWIMTELMEEEDRFQKTLAKGLKRFQILVTEGGKRGKIKGADAFDLFATYGFPLEMTAELAGEEGLKVDAAGFAEKFKQHQEISRADAEVKYKGGLADHSVETTRLHTATHLLNKALRTVLGDHVLQKGSNITPERLRFDFSHPQPMTPAELKQVEAIVNEQIKRGLPIDWQEMNLSDAREQGALGVFDSKYNERVKVYSVGDFSKEICGGPHVHNTGELEEFKILKEQSSSAGVRRIKATVTANKSAQAS